MNFKVRLLYFAFIFAIIYSLLLMDSLFSGLEKMNNTLFKISSETKLEFDLYMTFLYIFSGFCINSRTSLWMRCRRTSVRYSLINPTQQPGQTSVFCMKRVTNLKTLSHATSMLQKLLKVGFSHPFPNFKSTNKRISCSYLELLELLDE